MRRLLILGFVLSILTASCAPEAVTPTAEATPQPTAILEDPPACWGADLIYHPQLQQMLLVNCVAAPGTESPLTIWGWNGTHWQRITEGGPSGRILGGAAYDEKRNVLVLYGGRPVELGRCNQETWEWDGATWSQIDVQSPTVCDHVKMVYNASSGEAILFGGLDPSEDQVHQTWSWNGEQWKLNTEDGPSSRGHFGFVYDPNHRQVLLYGGYAQTVSDEFWAWKDDAWNQIDFPGPGTLSHLGMTYDTNENALYIFGGATTGSTFSSFTDKTWVLTGGKWNQLQPSDSPSKRGSPSMGYDPVRNRIVLYGGFDSGGNFGDTWEWDGQQWTCLTNC